MTDGTQERGTAVAEIARLARLAQPLTIAKMSDGRELAALIDPDTGAQTIKDVTSPSWRAPAPARVEQRVRLDAKDSFVAYLESFKTANARLFAALDPKGGGKIVGELDYHAAEAPPAPGLRAHRATYELKDSEEWQRWSAISGKLMGQQEFIRFLEENAADIETPAGADILELAQDFSVNRKVDFRQAVRLSNGDMSFEYAAKAEATSKSGEIAVPTKFVLRIPVFFGEPTMQVHAFLRWRCEQGEGLKLGVELHRPVYVRQSLFQQIGQEIAERTAVPLHYGEPL